MRNSFTAAVKRSLPDFLGDVVTLWLLINTPRSVAQVRFALCLCSHAAFCSTLSLLFSVGSHDVALNSFSLPHEL